MIRQSGNRFSLATNAERLSGDHASNNEIERADSKNRRALSDEDSACHWCFKAKWRTQVDAFWDAGIAAGGSDDGPPGLRDHHTSYYAAFLRDPDGNRIG